MSTTTSNESGKSIPFFRTFLTRCGPPWWNADLSLLLSVPSLPKGKAVTTTTSPETTTANVTANRSLSTTTVTSDSLSTDSKFKMNAFTLQHTRQYLRVEDSVSASATESVRKSVSWLAWRRLNHGTMAWHVLLHGQMKQLEAALATTEDQIYQVQIPISDCRFDWQFPFKCPYSLHCSLTIVLFDVEGWDSVYGKPNWKRSNPLGGHFRQVSFQFHLLLLLCVLGKRLRSWLSPDLRMHWEFGFIFELQYQIHHRGCNHEVVRKGACCFVVVNNITSLRRLDSRRSWGRGECQETQKKFIKEQEINS